MSIRCQVQYLRLPAIACLAEDELEILWSSDDASSDLGDWNECEWVAQESRDVFDFFWRWTFSDIVAFVLFILL